MSVELREAASRQHQEGSERRRTDPRLVYVPTIEGEET